MVFRIAQSPAVRVESGRNSEWAIEWGSIHSAGTRRQAKSEITFQLIAGCPYARWYRFLVKPQGDRRVRVSQLGLSALGVFRAVAEQCGASSPQASEVDVGLDDGPSIGVLLAGGDHANASPDRRRLQDALSVIIEIEETGTAVRGLE